MDPYTKRCAATKITSAEKLMYICKNQLGMFKMNINFITLIQKVKILTLSKYLIKGMQKVKSITYVYNSMKLSTYFFFQVLKKNMNKKYYLMVNLMLMAFYVYLMSV